MQARHTPDKKEFLRLARKGNLIPVYREILADLETPVSAYLKLGDRPYSYLLESVEGGETAARYSFLASSPSIVFKSKGKKVTIERGGRAESYQAEDPIAELEKLMAKYKQPAMKGLPPFTGGAVGYLGYDAVRFIEKIPDKNPDPLDVPDALFMFTETLVAFDHARKTLKVICNARVGDFGSAGEAYDHAVERIDQEIARLRGSGDAKRLSPEPPSAPALKVESNFTKAGHAAAVRGAKAHIKKGDIIQVVLSQRFRTRVHSDPFDVYRALRSINPSPYMFFLNCGAFKIAGSSPEIHVRLEDGKASLRPIAGTRPRGRDAADDLRLEKQLLADPKERAEHLMLVDLGRNDLGRICEYKSVRVRDFMTIERYSHVMHIVSHVEGLLRKGKNAFDLLRATFPAGTVSGAPKVRAMEIIDELENERRGFYSGVVGYFGYSGNLDSCIAIRTVLFKDGVAYVQAGGGIVADSDPATEYQETVNKAKAMMKAIEYAEHGVSA